MWMSSMSTHEMDGIVLKRITFLVLLGTDFLMYTPCRGGFIVLPSKEALSKNQPTCCRCHVPQQYPQQDFLFNDFAAYERINLGSLILPSLAVWFC